VSRIKFCGMTRAGDVAQAVALGVDCIGLVFAARSPRRLDAAVARELRMQLPAHVAAVALFMDNGADEIRRVIAQVQPDLLQFHGSEDDGFCRGFGLPYWKAIAMGGADAAVDAEALAQRFPGATAFLFDSHAAGEAGGSGRGFDWTRVPAALERLCGRQVLLAGGLHPDNVGDAIRTARPWGVDVSSGIEASPGIKDADKMRRFVEAVRRADRRR
jgi:phosphoribosylanthranilate isomerase